MQQARMPPAVSRRTISDQKIAVVHLLMQPLLDSSFRGQIFVVAGNAIFSRHQQIVVSSCIDARNQPLQIQVARQIWGKELFFHRYRHELDRLNGNDLSNHDPRHMQVDPSHAGLEENFLIKTISSYLSAGFKVVLDVHFINGELTTLAPLKAFFAKKSGGSRFKIVVHLHCMPDQYAFAPCEYSTQYTFRGISSDVTTGAEKRIRSNARKLEALLASGAVDAFIPVSRKAGDAFKDMQPIVDSNDRLIRHAIPEERIQVIENGVDQFLYVVHPPEEKREMRKEIGFSENVETIVSYSGRFENWKGSELLLRVLNYFEESEDERDKRIGFLFAVSKGHWRTRLAEYFRENYSTLIREGRLKVVVDVAKFTRGSSILRSEVADFFRRDMRDDGITGTPFDGGVINFPVQAASDIYFHPATTEACGLAVREALLSGNPVIAFGRDGLTEALTDSQGVIGKLLPFDQPSDLNARNEYYNKVARRLARAIRSLEKNSLDPEEIRGRVLKTGAFLVDRMAVRTDKSFEKL